MLDEKDLEKIFSDSKKDSQIAGTITGIIWKVLSFAGVVVVCYFLINFYAFKDKAQYWYKNDFKAEPAIDQSQPAVSQLVTVLEKKQEPVKQNIQPGMAENSIKIPAINIDAPISWRVSNLPKEVSAGLSKGVIQVNGTALPGEKGNVYITGHSSNYVWVKQKYNSIFSNISKLVVGDMIYVKFGTEVYVYKVYDQKIVAANDLSILDPTSESKLTLATCWPLGTSLKRMVVLANQVYPNPSKNKASREVIQFTKLPGIR
jgi:LPXTG-site transpeptidase (sortase) family protein